MRSFTYERLMTSAGGLGGVGTLGNRCRRRLAEGRGRSLAGGGGPGLGPHARVARTHDKGDTDGTHRRTRHEPGAAVEVTLEQLGLVERARAVPDQGLGVLEVVGVALVGD